jgi:hypothetical protein
MLKSCLSAYPSVCFIFVTIQRISIKYGGGWVHQILSKGMFVGPYGRNINPARVGLKLEWNFIEILSKLYIYSHQEIKHANCII